MGENEEHTDIALVDVEDIEVEPDNALTMRAERLAGSHACLNCGTDLKGPFCYYCGQPDRNFLRFFPALLREMMSDFLDLDSRFARTLKPLLFKPGRLTRDYLEGKRFRYTPPMRLYLFSSIAFFLLAAMLSSNAIEQTSLNRAEGEGVIRITPDAENFERAQEAMDNIPDDVRENLPFDPEEMKQSFAEAQRQAEEDILASEEGEESGQKEEHLFSSGDMQFNDKPWNRETNPIDIIWLPIWANDWINDEIEQSPEKADRINENPNLIVEQVFDVLPAMMFILLPAVALIFKFWYLFAKRFYVEHLIFALHNHAFLFVSLMLLLLLSIAEGLLKDGGAMLAAKISAGLVVAISVWIPIYLFVSLRHVYKQNWFFTFCKFGVIGLSYITLLGLVTSIVAILSFVLL
jgi:hypothetical protein